MKLHLVDGTYELFRSYYGGRPSVAPDGMEVGAVRSLMRSMLNLVTVEEATHVGVAFDHGIESFRNELFDGYKTGAGIDPKLFAQFDLAEEAIAAMGLTVWPMVEFEADDAIGAAALRWRDDVEQVVICSPDKDMGQCVVDDRVVLNDRMRKKVYDQAGIREKFGVEPASIPDYLALMGDTADGIPGLARWGAKSSSTVLARYKTLADIPDSEADWDIKVRGAAGLAKTLREGREDAELYKRLATLRTDVPLAESLGDLEWQGADREVLGAMCERLGDHSFMERVPRFR